ncbi:MAG TPA: hypothetical protein VII93_14880, partial [Anaerolineales bacterium]
AEQVKQLRETLRVHIDYISSFDRLHAEIAALRRRKECLFCALYPDDFDGLTCHGRDNSPPKWVRYSSPCGGPFIPSRCLICTDMHHLRQHSMVFSGIAGYFISIFG